MPQKCTVPTYLELIRQFQKKWSILNPVERSNQHDDFYLQLFQLTQEYALSDDVLENRDGFFLRVIDQLYDLNLGENGSLVSILLKEAHKEKIIQKASQIDKMMLNAIANVLYQKDSCFVEAQLLETSARIKTQSRLQSSKLMTSSMSRMKQSLQQSQTPKTTHSHQTSRSERQHTTGQQPSSRLQSQFQHSKQDETLDAALNDLSMASTNSVVHRKPFSTRATIQLSRLKFRIIFSGDVGPFDQVCRKYFNESGCLNEVPRRDRVEYYWGNLWSRLFRSGNDLGERSNRIEFWIDSQRFSSEWVAKVVLSMFRPLGLANMDQDVDGPEFSFSDLKGDHDYRELGTTREITEYGKLDACIASFQRFTDKLRAELHVSDADGFKVLPFDTPTISATNGGNRGIDNQVHATTGTLKP